MIFHSQYNRKEIDMFEKEVYIERRNQLKKQVGSGILFFPGNDESPMNYQANTFPFRQDSSFLYYWGLDFSGLDAIIDIDNDQEILFGYDFTVDDIVWMGPQETLAERAQKVGVPQSAPLDDLNVKIKEAVNKGRRVHYLPQYRADNVLKIERATGIHNASVNEKVSEEMIRAVVAQRSVKSAGEIKEIEAALDISYEMNKVAMHLSKPGIYEYEVAGVVESRALSLGSYVSFPIIFTIHGEVLHGHSHKNLMKDGDILILDSGAESPLHYASDITRTYPVSGKFSEVQKEVYNIVLAANEKAIEMIRPSIPFKDVHIQCAKIIAEGMKQLGFMKGNTDDAVATGAHAMFFPHGLGHMMGLDVHDMEGLGENFVGYNDDFKRGDQFGLAYLRLGKKLEPGYVVTVEPGIYFMPELINQWKTQKKCAEFIDYEKAEHYLGFSGVRIEDDVLITQDGNRVLGKWIAKTVEEVEDWCSR